MIIDTANKNEKLVYHYCSVSSFVSIISNKKLWLSDIYKTNDKSEKQYYGELVIDYLKNKFELSTEDENNLVKRLKDITDPRFEHEFSYACCFSECSDSLSQWKMYGDNGQGVCIGFDLNTLKKVNNSIISFDKVHYPPNFYKSSINRSMHSYIDIYAKTKSYPLIFDILMKKSGFCKNPSFSAEKEWRILLSSNKSYCGLISVEDPIDGIHNNKSVYGWKNDLYSLSMPKIRVVNNSIRTYYELDFSKVNNDLIKCIVIGPNSKLESIDVYNLLLNTGFASADNYEYYWLDKSRYDCIKRNIKVVKSKIPYRD